MGEVVAVVVVVVVVAAAVAAVVAPRLHAGVGEVVASVSSVQLRKAGVQQRAAERRRVILTPSRDPVPVLAPHDAAVRVRTRTTIATVQGIEELRIVAQDPGLLLERGPTRRCQAKLALVEESIVHPREVHHRLCRVLLPTGCTSRMLVRERAAGVVLELVACVRESQVLIGDSFAAAVLLRGHFLYIPRPSQSRVHRAWRRHDQ